MTSAMPLAQRILTIAIMAHNEEKVISQTIQSCFEQICPASYNIRVMVMANGCTDGTEQTVHRLENEYGNNLRLISIKEKGKTTALNRTISLINEEVKSGIEMPYVIFMDADCQFVGNNVLVNFLNRFTEIPSICAIGATNVPKNMYNRDNLVSAMYKATDELNKTLPENGISGGAYCIKLDVLQKFKFPEFQMADDMYVSMKLDGWMLRDRNINVSYSIPETLKGELKKRIRHEIATRKYFQYYYHLLKSEGHAALFAQPLSDKYRWSGFSFSQVLSQWLKIKKRRCQFLICLSFSIRLLAKVVASYKFRKISDNPALDYWQVER